MPRKAATARAATARAPAHPTCTSAYLSGLRILADDQETLLADLDGPGKSVTLCRGGDGGFGNTHFKSSTNRAPRKHTKGYPGEERWIWLRLKLIADAGLVGLPNAGKSTFLAASSGRPSQDRRLSLHHPAPAARGHPPVHNGKNLSWQTSPGLSKALMKALGSGTAF